MIIPRKSLDFPRTIPRSSLVYLWIIPGFCPDYSFIILEFIWMIPGLSLNYFWIIRKLSRNFPQTIPRLSLEFPWIFFGLSLDFPQIIPRFSLELYPDSIQLIVFCYISKRTCWKTLSFFNCFRSKCLFLPWSLVILFWYLITLFLFNSIQFNTIQLISI